MKTEYILVSLGSEGLFAIWITGHLFLYFSGAVTWATMLCDFLFSPHTSHSPNQMDKRNWRGRNHGNPHGVIIPIHLLAAPLGCSPPPAPQMNSECFPPSKAKALMGSGHHWQACISGLHISYVNICALRN